MAAHDGHRFAVWLALLSVAAAGCVAVVGLAERRVDVSAPTRRILGALLIVVCVASLLAVFGRYGSPVSLARKGWSAFKAPPPHAVNLNRRLLSFSGNGRYELWRLAWDDARKHPWLGSGAGTYERYFLQHEPSGIGRVRDAHGLYIETLAELGPVGLAILLATLLVPLAVAVRARRDRLVAAAVGAYTVFVVHALVDWDWELPAVTLVGLLCACAILIGARAAEDTRGISTPARAIAIAATVLIAAFAAIGLVGNSALKSSSDARQDGDWARASRDAQKAHSWQPWSEDPWLALGETQLAVGDASGARTSFRKATALDDGNWRAWYDLARASTGAARRRAVGRAAQLYPKADLPALLSAQGKAAGP